MGGNEIVYKTPEEGGPPPNERNPNGYFENPDAIGGKFDEIDNWDNRAVKLLWSLPLLPPDTKVKVVIMRRSMDTVVKSVTDYERGEVPMSRLQGVLDSIRLWCAGKPHIEVWYEDVLRHPAQECLRVINLLYPDFDPLSPAAPLDLTAMAKVVDKSLNHYG